MTESALSAAPKPLPQAGATVFVFDGKILASALVLEAGSANATAIINNPRLKFGRPMVKVAIDYRALGLKGKVLRYFAEGEVHADYEEAHEIWISKFEIAPKLPEKKAVGMRWRCSRSPILQTYSFT